MSQVFSQQSFTFPILNPDIDLAYLPTAAQNILSVGANAVQVNPFVMVADGTSSHIITVGDPDVIPGVHFEPVSLTLVQQVIDGLQAAGLSVELKVSVETYDRSLSKDFAPDDVDQWFAEYKAAVLDYAQLAEANGITRLIITNELESMTSQYRDKWLDLIAAVRAVYSGDIGVNALPVESTSLSFGDMVDYIGLSAYPILTTSTDPTVAELVDGWMQDQSGVHWFTLANQVHDLYGKPVVVSEVAFVSREGAASQANSPNLAGPVDEAAQANSYEAFFQVFSNLPSWFEGVSFWRALEVPLTSDIYLDDIYEGGPSGTPIVGKQAESVVHDWFSGLVRSEGVTLTGTASKTLLEGGWNDDTFISGPAPDTIDGGPGTDTAVYSGARGSYTATLQSDGSIQIVDYRQGAPDSVDTVKNVEQFQFTDKTVSASALLAAKPDLVARAVSLNATEVAAGGDVTVSYRIRNTGDAPALQGSTSLIYLSTDNVITSSDLVIGGKADGQIMGGAQVVNSVPVTLPWSLAAGTYYIGVIADAEHAVTGDNAANNASTPVAVTIAPNHAPVVTLPSASIRATANQTFQASNLVTVTDADAIDPKVVILIDATPGNGRIFIGGVAQQEGTPIILLPDQFAQASYHAGASGSDEIIAFAFDGKDFSNFTNFIVTVGNTAPVITPAASPLNLSAGQVVAVSPTLFTASDADAGDPMVVVLFDGSASAQSGSFRINGVTQAAGQPIIIPKDQLSQVTFEAGSGQPDDLFFAAFDGTTMSLFKTVHVDLIGLI